MTGICLRKDNITGKKSPNRLRNPNISIKIPKKGYFKKTRRMPPRKHRVPLTLFLLAKK